MMNWKPDVTSGTTVRTVFACLYAWRASGRKERYAAQVLGIDRQNLAHRDDFLTLEDAQAWAEQEYVRLLRVELASL